ncbi:MAG: hypothetical protein QT10_C0007G0007 [archaeon GW2011_AR19]|nr:MAG: hypothetical protein QT10_C0007G0007 [archaeon GW2011_AR19]
MKTIIGKSYLIVPHAGGELTFQYPAFEGTYGSVAKAIDKEGLKRPNSPETASLVYDAFQNPNNKYSKEIIDILNNINNNYFWEFIGNLYLPKSGEKINNGVIIEHNPKIKNGKLIMNKNSLIKRLQSKDSNVKFVPFGFKTGEQTWQELEKNLYIIARYGKEGAEKIAKVASKYKNKPYIFSFDSVDEEKVPMSALYRSRGFGDRLYVDGNDWDDDSRGLAFGVCGDNNSS